MHQVLFPQHGLPVLYKRSDLPFKAQSSAAILEFTSIDFAKPTIHWAALSLSSPPHPESPLVLITEHRCSVLASPQLVLTTSPVSHVLPSPCFDPHDTKTLACISTTFTRIGLEACCLNAFLFRWNPYFIKLPARKETHFLFVSLFFFIFFSSSPPHPQPIIFPYFSQFVSKALKDIENSRCLCCVSGCHNWSELHRCNT